MGNKNKNMKKMQFIIKILFLLNLINPYFNIFASTKTICSKCHSKLILKDNNQSSHNKNINSYIYKNFDEIIKKDPWFQLLNQSKSPHQLCLKGITTPNNFLNKLKHLYEKNFHLINQEHTANYQPKIPLIIHEIWLGSEIPIKYKKWLKEWKQKHLNWKIIVWTEKNIKKYFPMGLKNQIMYDRVDAVKNYGSMSDIIRYEILEKFGGLYIDVDNKCYQTFTPLHYNFDFYAGLDNFSFVCLCAIGIFACKPHHPILKYCIQKVHKYQYQKKNIDYSAWKCKTEGDKTLIDMLVCIDSGLFTEAIVKCIGQANNKDIIFPQGYISRTGRFPDVENYTLSKHWYDGSWHNYWYEHFNGNMSLFNPIKS